MALFFLASEIYRQLPLAGSYNLVSLFCKFLIVITVGRLLIVRRAEKKIVELRNVRVLMAIKMLYATECFGMSTRFFYDIIRKNVYCSGTSSANLPQAANISIAFLSNLVLP